MSRFSLGLSALALSVASPALAEVTAAELWAEWQSQSAMQRQDLAAAQVEETDDGLILRDVTSTFRDEDVATVARVETIEMIENGDGSVSVVVSDPYQISIEVAEPLGDEPAQISMDLTHDGLDITAGGTVEARTYTYRADRVSLENLQLSGGNSAPPEIDVVMGFEGLEADYVVDVSVEDQIEFTSSGTMDRIAVAMTIAPPPGDPGTAKLSFILNDAVSEASGAVTSLAALAPVAGASAALPEGTSITTSLDYGSVRAEFDFEEGFEQVEALYNNAGGSFAFTIGSEEFLYAFETAQPSFTLSGTDLPLPVEVSAASSAFSVAMPLAASDNPQPFNSRLALNDVTIADEVWALADPIQAFPRDPITAIFDVSGTMQVLLDPLGPEAMESNTPPVEVRTMTLNELRLSFAGAELTGTGDVTFAPGQIVPQPVGSVDLGLSGGMGLMDRLQSSGLIPLEQLAMARGLLGAFARPGATPDTLESTIEFTPEGGITANGLPIQ